MPHPSHQPDGTAAPIHPNEQPTTVRPLVEHVSPYAAPRGSLGNKQLLAFDEALIHKYNRSGPRYTSYPTALEFMPVSYTHLTLPTTILV